MNDNQELFHTVLNHTSDMIMICDRNRHIVYITPNAFENTGYRPEEVQNRDIFFMIHPEDREYLEQRHKNLLESKQSNSSEYRIIKKNGQVRYYECKTTPLPETDNYLQVVTTRDVTERKLIELELERHKDRHQILQKSLKNFSHDLSSVMKLTDLEERLMKELEVILPGSKPYILKTYPDIESRTNLQELSIGKIEIVSNHVFIKIGERHNQPYIVSINSSSIHENMESIWLETLAFYTVMVFENLIMIEGLMDQLETALQSKETPQWVLRMMFNLQEQQRMTLSSDLHDTVLQDQIDLFRRMESLLGRYEIEVEAKAQLKDIEQGLLDTIHDIRMTCNNLRPPLLRELGLGRALENLFEHIQVTSTFKIIFTSEDISGVQLSDEETITIYRIVQELLHHAEAYSKANLIKFKLYCENDQLKMMYCDDGVGDDALETSQTLQHMGLTSISQRAQSLGGKFEFSSNLISGFIAILEIPIKEKGVKSDG
jgi:two-component system, NarL family, sensor histidine kinase ComP